MRAFRIDPNKIKPVSKASRLTHLFGIFYVILLIFLTGFILDTESTKTDLKILIYCFIGITSLSIILSVFIQPRYRFSNLIVNIDLEAGVISREGDNSKSVKINFSDIGRIKFTGDGVIIFKKGIHTILSFFDSSGNLYDRKTKFIIPFEMEDYNEIKQLINTGYNTVYTK